jgi:signal transduction histidine kinase
MQGPSRHHLPWRFYVSLLALPLTVVVIVTALAIGAVNVLSAVRAYVGGESLWSKSRSEAVQHLLRYAESHDEADLQRFHSTLSVIHFDRLARETMMRPGFDDAEARGYFAAAGNAPQDVGKMVTLFRYFGHLWLFNEARETWARGDSLVDQLQARAEQLRQVVAAGAPNERVRAAVAKVMDVNAELQRAERHFSITVGQTSRQTETLLIASLVTIACVLTLVSLLQMRRVLLKQAEQQAALDAVNRSWELASKSVGIGLYEMDHAAQTISLDAKSAEFHGLGTQPVVVPRATVRALIIEEDAAPTRGGIDAAIDTGELYKIVYRVRWPDQSVHALEATGRLLRPTPAEPGRLVGVLRDVTDELARTETASRREAAERVAQAQRQFLSRLSHELRTPLNAILGFAQLMMMRTDQLSPAQTRQLEMIFGAGKQLLALVEDVLDLSKVESGDVRVEQREVDVCATLRACAALIEGQRARLGVALVDRLPATPLMALADPQRLQQVFTNLLTNACKYNRPDGQVLLEARLSGDQVLIDITDTGIGLGEDDIAQLFQPFKRVAPGTHIEGTGLGLYIVKQLVERMQGCVSVRSNRGQGSCFTVALPALPVTTVAKAGA